MTSKTATGNIWAMWYTKEVKSSGLKNERSPTKNTLRNTEILMKKTSHESAALVIGAIVIILITLLFWWRSSPSMNATEGTQEVVEASIYDKLRTVNAESLVGMQRQTPDLALLDLRSAESYQSEHLLHARHIVDLATLRGIIESQAKVVLMLDATTTPTTELETLLTNSEDKIVLYRDNLELYKSRGGTTVKAPDTENVSDVAKVQFVSVEEAKKNIEQGFYTLLDVQNKEAYLKSHLDGAHNMPLAELEKNIDAVPRGGILLVYGANKSESFAAAAILYDLQRFGIKALDGGLEAWVAKGYKTYSGELKK